MLIGGGIPFCRGKGGRHSAARADGPNVVPCPSLRVANQVDRSGGAVLVGVVVPLRVMLTRDETLWSIVKGVGCGAR
ncbi:MAG: hypothetical protein A4E58_00603 [Syntrophorhabdus sp. PtaB.Bin006]|nr:MAG: hypothetical protein A4E58_00603 [Syntrophorhabdus sp. PtaB.Bin006]